MSFKKMHTPLVTSEIEAAVEKGRVEFESFLGQPPSGQPLSDQFQLMLGVADRLLENFELQKFDARVNNKITTEELKGMLLGAFEAVSYLKNLSPLLMEDKGVGTIMQAAYSNLQEACVTYAMRSSPLDGDEGLAAEYVSIVTRDSAPLEKLEA